MRRMEELMRCIISPGEKMGEKFSLGIVARYPRQWYLQSHLEYDKLLIALCNLSAVLTFFPAVRVFERKMHG